MKILWAAMIGLSATAFAFEGDWSTWDKPQGAEEAQAGDTRTYGYSAGETGETGIYGLRTLGRSESRWMGSLTGPSPSEEGREGISRFDWTRRLGRAEAHHIEGSARTAYLGSDPVSVASAAESKELGCNLVEANRHLGRDEARAIDLEAGASGEPPTTWEMEEDDERKAAAEAAREDC